MATIDEAAVFEFYMAKFEELEKQDGGYYPSKHDEPALSQTAEHFGIDKDEASRIFTEYSEQAAGIEMAALRRLPAAIRQEKVRKRLHDIVCNNRDLPFFKTEGEPSEGITNPLDVLSEAYQGLVETVADAGWTIPLDIDIHRFEELKTASCDETTIDSFMSEYYTDAKMRLLSRRIQRSITNDAQRKTFEESIFSFNNDQFQICRIGLVAVLEGLISSYNPEPKDVRLMHVCKHQSQTAQKKKQNIKALCWLSMYTFISNCYKQSDFAVAEPDVMNRHWIQHGRTTRVADRIECLQLINAISTVACIKTADTFS